MNPYISIEKESKLMNISLETNEKETKNKKIRDVLVFGFENNFQNPLSGNIFFVSLFLKQ